MKTLFFLIILIIGNFSYQTMLATPDYIIAAERSFFQVGAILYYLLFMKVTS